MTEPIEKRFGTLLSRVENWNGEKPARCLWAWRYATQGKGLLGRAALAGMDCTAPLPPVETLLGVAGWTYCGRHTVRVLTLNEAKDVEEKARELPGLSWHLWEQEPADALPASDEGERLKAAQGEPPDAGVFTLKHAAVYGRAPEVGCGWCRVNLDLALEKGWVKEELRLGEVVLKLDRGVPTAALWDPVTKLLRE